mmetsp:Transcript_73147/g.145070  ORF Transcript_73147/g.145070 Transcript_73147/m.145070 type:complete len:122 (+) Transcript_73147:88-453(+)
MGASIDCQAGRPEATVDEEEAMLSQPSQMPRRSSRLVSRQQAVATVLSQGGSPLHQLRYHRTLNENAKMLFESKGSKAWVSGSHRPACESKRWGEAGFVQTQFQLSEFAYDYGPRCFSLAS